MCDQFHDLFSEFPDIQEITPRELSKRVEKERIVLVDVRTPQERAVSIIPNAISKDDFESAPAQYAGRTVVTYCTIGYRSGLYAKELEERGIPATNLKGSILAWVNDGLPVVTADGNLTRRVHVYGPRWSLLPDGYEPVW